MSFAMMRAKRSAKAAAATLGAGFCRSGRHVPGRQLRPVLVVLEDRRLLSTFNVTSTADDGTGTLRWAIAQANSATSRRRD